MFQGNKFGLKSCEDGKKFEEKFSSIKFCVYRRKNIDIQNFTRGVKFCDEYKICIDTKFYKIVKFCGSIKIKQMFKYSSIIK